MAVGGSVHAVRLRVTRLDAAGVADVGDDNMYVSSALVTVSWAPQNSDDEEIEQKNGAGDVCLYYKKKGALKGLEVKLQVCTMDPELIELLSGGEVITSSGNTIGYAMPEVGVDPQPNGISLEFWSRRIVGGAPANDRPYYWHLMPRGRFSRDEQTHGNEAALASFTGAFEQNDGWGLGPGDVWPATTESGRVYQYIETATLPAATDAYAAVPA